jgi:hypothetical protein
MEGSMSLQYLGFLQTTQHCNPEDSILHSHRYENLKSNGSPLLLLLLSHCNLPYHIVPQSMLLDMAGTGFVKHTVG